MNILLFGIGNVGKTTTGSVLAKKIGYDFYDLDEEVEKYCNMTIAEFIRTIWPYERDKIRGTVIGQILTKKGNKVVAVTPMYYSVWFNKYLKRDDVLAIELQDEPANIFSRLIFTDDNGIVLEDSVKYREKHRKYFLNEIKKDITAHRRSFIKIENKFAIKNDSPEVVASRLIEQFREIIL